MPAPRPLPRKYLTLLEEARSELRTLGNQANTAITLLDRHPHSPAKAKDLIREIEAKTYRINCDLTQIRLADNCDECPLFPAQPKTKDQLLAIAEMLTEQADLTRRMATEDIPPKSRVPSLN